MTNPTRNEITDTTRLYEGYAMSSEQVAACNCAVLTRSEVEELGYENPQHDRYVIVRDNANDDIALVGIATAH